MRRFLKYGSVAALLTVSIPAGAEYPVIDASALEKATQQLSEMKKQLEELQAFNDKLQAQINAIGEAGQIAVPIFNMAKVGSQLRQDAQCLVPDLSKLMPSLSFEDVNFGSICEAASAYRQTLWVDPETKRGLRYSERQKLRKELEQRRENILVDITSKALAQGDIAADTALQLNEAADEHERNVKATRQSNERLNLIPQGQVMIARGLAQQNQILATMLKLQAAFIMKAGVPVDSIIAVEEEE
ncbi:hypothetical protein HH303_18500 [Rhodospirillaceae bacterium KN72]|uniref:Uncharacterized protein n=1 Tax=Pacificispira spongiicola TaxID=2729598 RepID=A0A7Y0E3J6_9PROT|nr:hypothetical protein [Pacificispira spongiicola]NMM46488.1 hypothetical protein [Pacificispira spongiicola]